MTLFSLLGLLYIYGRIHVTSCFFLQQSKSWDLIRKNDIFPSICVSRSRNVWLRAKTGDDYETEAQRLLEKAQRLRSEISADLSESESIKADNSLFDENVVGENEDKTDEVWYRLYVDIGRENGTWMDPRWGASGQRIELTLDVGFSRSKDADSYIASQMVDDNRSGSTSNVYSVSVKTNARLRGGFDQMKCVSGGYRIDQPSGIQQSSVVRFFVSTEGSSNFGDIWVPKGNLYFSIPCFLNDISKLSNKESPVTVREKGWHTGWYREESRIVGVFKAVLLEQALQRDNQSIF